MEVKPVVIVHPLGNALSRLAEALEHNQEAEGIEVHQCENMEEATQVILNSGTSLILGSDPRTIAQLLHKNFKRFKPMKNKTIIINNRRLPPRSLKKLDKLGLTDYIVEPIAAKSLQYKIKMQIRALSIKKQQDEDFEFHSKGEQEASDDESKTLQEQEREELIGNEAKKSRASEQEAEDRELYGEKPTREENDGEDLYGDQGSTNRREEAAPDDEMSSEEEGETLDYQRGPKKRHELDREVDYKEEEAQEEATKAQGEVAPSSGPLRGKAQTDHLDHGPLEGKAQTDQLSSDPLSGDIQDQGPQAPLLEEELEKTRPASMLEASSPHKKAPDGTDLVDQDPPAMDPKEATQEARSAEELATTQKAQPRPQDVEDYSAKDDTPEGLINDQRDEDLYGRKPKKQHPPQTQGDESGEKSASEKPDDPGAGADANENARSMADLFGSSAHQQRKAPSKKPPIAPPQAAQDPTDPAPPTASKEGQAHPQAEIENAKPPSPKQEAKAPTKASSQPSRKGSEPAPKPTSSEQEELTPPPSDLPEALIRSEDLVAELLQEHGPLGSSQEAQESSPRPEEESLDPTEETSCQVHRPEMAKDQSAEALVDVELLSALRNLKILQQMQEEQAPRLIVDDYLKEFHELFGGALDLRYQGQMIYQSALNQILRPQIREKLASIHPLSLTYNEAGECPLSGQTPFGLIKAMHFDQNHIIYCYLTEQNQAQQQRYLQLTVAQLWGTIQDLALAPPPPLKLAPKTRATSFLKRLAGVSS